MEVDKITVIILREDLSKTERKKNKKKTSWDMNKKPRKKRLKTNKRRTANMCKFVKRPIHRLVLKPNQ